MKKDNKGFSLVELIIVIAIMAVLVGVLAPQFIKYVEQSRRSRDIQTAQEIREACLADIADGLITASVGTQTNVTASTFSSITELPSIAGNLNNTHGDPFSYTCDPVAGTCEVFGAGYELSDDLAASAYKTAS